MKSTKEERAELRDRAKRLAETYDQLNALHEELRVLTENISEHVRYVRQTLQQVRRVPISAKPSTR